MALKIHRRADVERGLMIGITGLPGVGKTTLAATMPSPLILDCEGGTFVLPEDSPVDIHSEWSAPKGQQVKELLAVLRDVWTLDPQPYRTLVLDSWTRIDQWIEDEVLGRYENARSLAACGDGFGRGHNEHKNETLKLIAALRRFQERKGMHVVWTMHTKVKSDNKPSGAPVSVYTQEGNGRSVVQVQQHCDVVAMLEQEITVVKEKGQQAGKAKGQGRLQLVSGKLPYAELKDRFHDDTGARIIRVERGVNPYAAEMGQ